jgi:hypothetical protein
MLAEGTDEPLPDCDLPPEDLAPRRAFTVSQIQAGLPDLRGFGWDDLRCRSRRMI